MSELKETTVSRARFVLRQPAPEHEQEEARPPATRLQRDPLAQVGGRPGGATAGVHAAILSRATAAQPGRAPASLLRLQRLYGNRYVSRVVDLSRKGDGEGDAAPEIEADIQRERGNGQVLDGTVRAQMEPALGADFSGVRVHTGRQADTLNRDLSARAFTTGHDIFFKQDEYSPGSSSGQELLAHELTHVVQQNDGIRRAQAPDEELEDETGGKVMAKTIQAKPETVQRAQAPDEEPEEETDGKVLAKRVQAKLTVGAADDQYEQEADRAAGQVMRAFRQGAQRQPEQDDERDKLLQAKLDTGPTELRTAMQFTRAHVPTVQLIRHRPDTGSIIEHGGRKWEVTESKENNPSVTIVSIGEKNRKSAKMNWQKDDFWNTTPGKPGAKGSESDVDRRRKDPTHEGLPKETVLQEFAAAKDRALDQMKAYLGDRVKNKNANRKRIDDITLGHFHPTAHDPEPYIEVPPDNACEWTYDWAEQTGRIWTLSMDSDNPLQDSPQEPHVGFTVESAQYKTFSPERRIGHIWLNEVPVWRKQAE